jgi:hypothetical protein
MNNNILTMRSYLLEMICVCSLLVTSVVAESDAWSEVETHGCRAYSQEEKNRAQQLHRKAAGFKGQGNLHAAIQTLKQAIKITPRSADLQHDLAMVDLGGGLLANGVIFFFFFFNHLCYCLWTGVFRKWPKAPRL